MTDNHPYLSPNLRLNNLKGAAHKELYEMQMPFTFIRISNDSVSTATFKQLLSSGKDILKNGKLRLLSFYLDLLVSLPVQSWYTRPNMRKHSTNRQNSRRVIPSM